LISFTGVATPVTAPATQVIWMIRNNTDGDFIFSPVGGTGVNIVRGTTRFIFYSDFDSAFIDISDELGEQYDGKPWVVETATTILTPGDQVIADSSVGGPFTLAFDIPVGYSTVRNQIIVKTYGGATDNPITITTTAGEPINGIVEDLILDVNYQELKFVYSSGRGWVI